MSDEWFWVQVPVVASAQIPKLRVLTVWSPGRWLCCCCSVAKLCPTLCDPMNCSTPGSSVLHYLPEFVHTHVHWVGDAIQPSHPVPPRSPPALNLSQHHDLFQWMDSLHQVAILLELQLQHQSFQGIFRTDFLKNWLAWYPCSVRDSQESFLTQFLSNIISICLTYNKQ